VLELSTATGLFRSGDSSSGRETQSRAFFRQPGTDELYSGVANRTASASAIASFSRTTVAGRGPTSSSASYGGTSFSPSYSSTSTPAGAAAAASRSSSVL
jgi:hypothetical protein